MITSVWTVTYRIASLASPMKLVQSVPTVSYFPMEPALLTAVMGSTSVTNTHSLLAMNVQSVVVCARRKTLV